MYAVGSGLVRRGGHDAALLGRAADDEEPGLARTLRIRQARHRHIERVGIGEENPADGYDVHRR